MNNQGKRAHDAAPLHYDQDKSSALRATVEAASTRQSAFASKKVILQSTPGRSCGIRRFNFLDSRANGGKS